MAGLVLRRTYSKHRDHCDKVRSAASQTLQMSLPGARATVPHHQTSAVRSRNSNSLAPHSQHTNAPTAHGSCEDPRAVLTKCESAIHVHVCSRAHPQCEARARWRNRLRGLALESPLLRVCAEGRRCNPVQRDGRTMGGSHSRLTNGFCLLDLPALRAV